MLQLKNTYINTVFDNINDIPKQLGCELARLRESGGFTEIDMFEEYVVFLKDMDFITNETCEYMKEALQDIRDIIIKQYKDAFGVEFK